MSGSLAAQGKPRRGMAQALLVTLIAVVVMKAAEHIALPGIDPNVAATLDSGARQRLSVMMLGTVPWLTALAFAELVYLFVPPVRRWRDRNAATASAFDRIALIGGLVLAAIQALGLAGALADVRGLVAEPGTLFTVTTIASLVGACALVMMLAAAISRHGIGNGFWVLFAAGQFATMQTAYATAQRLVGQGAIAPELALAAGAIAAAVAVAVVALLIAREKAGVMRADAVVWPPLLGAMLADWIGVFVAAITVAYWPVVVVAAAAVLAGLLSLLYPHRDIGGELVRVTALVLAGSVAATGFFNTASGFGLLPEASVIVPCVVVLFIVARCWQTAAVSPPSDDPKSPS